MPDNTVQFRKSRGGRCLYKVDGATVTWIIVKEKYVKITVCDSASNAEDILTDETVLNATEEEFRSAHADALEICTLMKIV